MTKKHSQLTTLLIISGFILLLILVHLGENYLAYHSGNRDGEITHPLFVFFFNVSYSTILFIGIALPFLPKPFMYGLLFRSILIIVIINILVSIAYQALWRPRIGIDDANIFFVYARHLAGGHGLVYNIGGERVEGFSSLLWVLIGACAFRLSSAPEQMLLLLNVLLLSGTTIIITEYLRYILVKGHKNVIMFLLGYLGIICLTPDYIVWMTNSLMDTCVWSFLLVSITGLLLLFPCFPLKRTVGLLCALLVLLIITRPESMLWGCVFIGLSSIRIFQKTSRKKACILCGILLATYGISLGALTAFRIYYFGYPFPNTYYAKVSPSFVYNFQEGFKYLTSYIRHSFIVMLIVFISIITNSKLVIRLIYCLVYDKQVNTNNILNIERFILNGVCMIGLAIPILSGGDHFSSFRFYQTIYPLLIINALLFLSETDILQMPELNNIIKNGSTNLIICLILLTGWFVSEVRWGNLGSSFLAGEFRLAEYQRVRGGRLREFFADINMSISLGVIAAGGIKVTYPREVIDLMGLNNTKMGHSHGKRFGFKNHAAFDKNIFYELKPTLLINDDDCAYKTLSFCEKMSNFKGIECDEQFNNMYACVEIIKSQNSEKNKLRRLYARKDFLDTLCVTSQYHVNETFPIISSKGIEIATRSYCR